MYTILCYLEFDIVLRIKLGMILSESETFTVMESVDIDGSGDIDRDEFEACESNPFVTFVLWHKSECSAGMAHLTSKSEQWMTVSKILIGYVQASVAAHRWFMDRCQYLCVLLTGTEGRTTADAGRDSVSRQLAPFATNIGGSFTFHSVSDLRACQQPEMRRLGQLCARMVMI